MLSTETSESENTASRKLGIPSNSESETNLPVSLKKKIRKYYEGRLL